MEVALQIEDCSGKPGETGETFRAEALSQGHIELKSNSI